MFLNNEDRHIKGLEPRGVFDSILPASDHDDTRIGIGKGERDRRRARCEGMTVGNGGVRVV